MTRTTRSAASREASKNSTSNMTQTPQKASNGNMPREDESLASTMRELQTASPQGLTLHEATTDNGVEVMGAGIKELLQTITRLEELGLDKQVVDLPKIVVIGDQSAGKSSIIEAISEIRVPRSTGTCTRCPFHLNLEKKDAAWSCQVDLLQKFTCEVGVSRRPSDRTHNEFPGWRRNIKPVPLKFKTLSTKSDIEDTLHRAQLATLNPGTDWHTYVDGSVPGIGEPTELQVDFSPNPIVVHITGPNLPNLSLVDLPGIITQTEDAKKSHLPKTVRNLAKSYIKSKYSLVLLAVSMEGDIANSSASGLMRELKVESRCVGILTKPDRLPKGDPTDVWKAIISNQKFAVKHSYYVTKQPAQVEMSQVDHKEARKQEELFFKSEKPWCTEFAEFEHRFGTRNLQQCLSGKLVSLISQTLPTIREKVEQKLRSVDAELSLLPEPPATNAIHIVLNSINQLVLAISAEIEGLPPSNRFRNAWKQIKDEFCGDIYSLRPMLLVTSDEPKSLAIRERSADPRTPTNNVIHVLDTDDDGNASATADESPTKKRKAGDAATPFTTPSRKSGASKLRGRMADKARRFPLNEVRKLIKDFSTSSLPNEVNPKVTDCLVGDCLAYWEDASTKALLALKARLDEHLSRVFGEVLGQFEKTEFFDKARKIVDTYVAAHFELQHGDGVGACDRFLKLELARPCTENEESWEANRQKEYEIFHGARYRARAMAHFAKMERTTGKPMNNNEKEKKIAGDGLLRAQLGADPYELVVQTMAKVRGYYNIASSRYCDNVCMSVQAELFGALTLKSDLHQEMVTELNATDNDACIRLLADDPVREARRQDLKRQREALVSAQECLDELQAKYYDNSAMETIEPMDDDDEDGLPLSPSAGRSNRHELDYSSDGDAMEV